MVATQKGGGELTPAGNRATRPKNMMPMTLASQQSRKACLFFEPSYGDAL